MTQHIVNISGGKDSASCYMLAIMRGKPFRAVTADTGHENEITYDWISKLSARTGGRREERKMTIYQDTDIITDDMARELMGCGACSIALNCVGCTVEEAAAKAPWHALRYAVAYLTPERRAACEKEIEKMTKRKQVFPELRDQDEIDKLDNTSRGWWIVPGLAVGLIAWCLIIYWIIGTLQSL